MEVRDFHQPALRRSLRALRDISFRLDGERVEIGLRGFGGFRPLALQGQQVMLHIWTNGAWRDIRGKLEYAAALPRHGTWYKYRFVPDKPHETSLILEIGRCRWTNVEYLAILLDREWRLLNRLFKAPAEKA